MGIDFEAEGLLDGVEGAEERRARLELLQDLEQKGFELEDLRAGASEGRLPSMQVEYALEGAVPRYTMEDVAEKSGLGIEGFKKLNRAIGLARPAPDERAFTETDVDGARNARQALDAGLPEEDMLQITRVASRSAAAVAGAAFTSVGEAFAEAGDTEQDLALRYAEATRALTPLLAESIERMVLIHLRELARMTVVTEEQLRTGRLPDAQQIAVCFADLVGFTRLGEQLEPEQIGAVGERLGELAGEVAAPPVRLVKTLGDAAMLVSAEPEPLVRAALELVESAAAEGEGFPDLRSGVAFGPGLPRAGDWYGRPVNLASRITNVARAGSVLGTEDLRDAVEGDYQWSFAGRRRFKGVRDQVALYRVRQGGG